MFLPVRLEIWKYLSLLILHEYLPLLLNVINLNLLTFARFIVKCPHLGQNNKTLNDFNIEYQLKMDA